MTYLLKRISLIYLIVLFSLKGITQVTSSQEIDYIAELEAVQSPITNTFISCSMRRLGHIKTIDEQILIHRSIDNGASWNLIHSILPDPGTRLIDPVITQDEQGYYYVIFMRIGDPTLPINQRMTQLELYRSKDDGLSWQFVSHPYRGYFPDYPQVISKGNGELYLAFGYADGKKTSDNAWVQSIRFIKSTDAGETWTAPVVLNYPNEKETQIGLTDLNWGIDSTIHLCFGSSLFKGPCYVKSNDLGKTWSPFILSDQNISKTETSVLSKVLSNPAVDYLGILSHRPHFVSTTISYHYKKNNQLETTIIGNGAYAEGLLTDDKIIHVVYNQLENDTFRLKYTGSSNQGVTFTKPVILYQAPFIFSELGEYQSLILGNDNQFHLTFCDWGDSSKAKTLIFEPLKLDYSPIAINPKQATSDYSIFPNPFSETITIKNLHNINFKKISISTIDGKVLKSFTINKPKESYEIDVSSLTNGSYLVTIEEKHRYIVHKIIK